MSEPENQDALIVRSAEFDASVQRFSLLSGKSMEATLLDQARLFVADAVKVTPPFSGGAGQGASVARRQGDASIERNLARLFAATDLVGSRRVTHLFGRRDVAGLPYVVAERERHPDVQRLYDEEKSRARGASKLRFSRRRIPVDAKKVRRVARAEKRKIGWLAAGYLQAAMRLGAVIPAWVRRHGSAPGAVRVQMGRDVLIVAIENRVGYSQKVGGMERRLAFALKKRRDAMERQIPNLLKQHEKVL